MLLGGVEAEHQVENHFVYLFGGAVGLVYLIDDYQGIEAEFEGLVHHEAGLRHGAFEGIDEQQYAVGHIEYPFHFATEVGVAGGVDDVDLGALVLDGDVLGEDRDAAFPFLVVAVHDQFAGVLVIAEELSGEEHFVHQGGLPVVDVGDDGDVADRLHKGGGFWGCRFKRAKVRVFVQAKLINALALVSGGVGE